MHSPNGRPPTPPTTSAGTPPSSQLYSPPSTPSASSADTGFFQSPPRLGNQYLTDVAFQRILALYVPLQRQRRPLVHDLTLLGEKVLSTSVLRHLEDAERHPPELESRDAFAAQRDDALRTSEGWKRLLEMGTREGCVAEGYDGKLGRMGQFARYYIFSPSSAIVTCPFAMTDGAARLLSKHLSPPPPPPPSTLPFEGPAYTERARESEAARRVFKRAFACLVSRDPSNSWTSGQWMTERPGGSDVSRTETLATYAPTGQPASDDGPWSISGFKFFSSATDSDMTVLLARTPTNARLSAFYAPMRRGDGSRNGVTISRLKKKLGTKALPTAELELSDMRAWMIGNEGEGVRELATVLNITRVHNSVSAVSFMRRALAVAKSYSRVRLVAHGTPLHSNPLHLRTLARLELLTRAATHLAFLAVHLLSLAESPLSTPRPSGPHTPAATAATLLRLLTPLTKAVTAKLSLAVISECIECLGGIGYLENEEPLNLARLLRDAQVLAIWEGTTNVLIVDLVHTLKSAGALATLSDWLRDNLASSAATSGEESDVLERCKVAVWAEWGSVEEMIEGGSVEELTAAGRRVLWRLAWVMVGTLLLLDARADRNGTATEVARRWVLEGFSEGKADADGNGNGNGNGSGGVNVNSRRQERWDRAVVWGDEAGERPRL